MATFRSYTAKLLAGVQWARSFYGERFTEGFIALFADTLAEASNQAVKARFEGASTYPLDALPQSGANKELERYDGDTDATYKQRLLAAFSIWQQAGTPQAVEAALDAFGYPAAVVWEDAEWVRPPQPWWSQFVVVFPVGTHPVIPTTQVYGDGSVYGDGQLYGISGITATEVDGIRRLVRKWKRSASICRWLIFEVSGTGTGPTFIGTSFAIGAV